MIKIEKRKTGNYAYEVKGSYDPKIKNTRYKKTYLGIVSGYNPDGSPIIKRKWSNSVLKPFLADLDKPIKKDSKLETRLEGLKGSYLCYSYYSVILKNYFELYILDSNKPKIFINISLNKAKVSDLVFIQLTDSKELISKVRNKKLVVISSTGDKPLFDRFIHHNLELESELNHYLYLTFLFEKLIKLCELKYKDKAVKDALEKFLTSLAEKPITNNNLLRLSKEIEQNLSSNE